MAQRNIVGVAQAHPEIAKKGIMLRKFGQEVIRITAGKRIHGTGAVPGGINKLVTAEERDSLKRDLPQMLQWAQDAVMIWPSSCTHKTRRCTTDLAAFAPT